MSGKYGAIPTTVDGMDFASRAEARRYRELRSLARAGAISDLTCHNRYRLAVNGVRIGSYTDDFAYIQDGKRVVEDVKGGPVSRDYPLRKKLMLALHGIEIQEIRS